MKDYTTLRMRGVCAIACLSILFYFSTQAIGQLRPNLGTASTYAIFTGGGAINVATGDTAVLTGDVGQDGAYAFNGFPPSTYTGTLNQNNSASALAKQDLISAQTADGLVACGTVLSTTVVDGQSFDPGVYCSGGATTTVGNITFNAHGDGTAIFIVKIGGALTAHSTTHILLSNNARAANIYWFVNGQVTVADSSSFTGTIIANGAISFAGKSSLNGRALVAPLGAINLAANHMSISTDTGSTVNNLTVVKPASGDSILRNTLNDTIRWTGTGIARVKTLQYSLDSGRTWSTIATITTDSLMYLWHVPDTTSTKAMVRVTDTNNLRGESRIFKIISNQITVTHPALAEVITGGTQNYQVTWTGTGLTKKKIFEYSLDSGLTWKTIGTISADTFAYRWNVPDTASKRAMVRITDSLGVTGKSGLFTIGSSRITVLHPASGEILASGTLNYQITWSGTGLTARKTFELSLDGGLTWKLIGTLTADVFNYYWRVPDTASTMAVIRITDSNGISGKSSIFAIQSTKTLIVVRPVAGEVVASGMQGYQITWAGNGLTAQKSFELSLDGGLTWVSIGSISADVFTYSWNVPDTVSSQAVIRITNNNGTTSVSGVSGVFSIRRNVGSIVVTHPVAGEVVDGGYVNFPINFTATNVTAQKTFEYSLNGGATWSLIGIMNSDGQSYAWASVPNVATTQALVRIRDANGITGISGLFTISVKPNIGTINEVILSGLDNAQNIGNRRQLGISWTYTPDIGTSVEVEYSLDYMVTWSHIATVPVTESPNSTAWLTTASGYYNPVFIRVTSSLGMTRLSSAFSIGSSASVASEASKNGYSVSNYPNPASSQTTIKLILPVPSDVTLTLLDALGREVDMIASGHLGAGSVEIPFITDKLLAGNYIYVLQAGATRLVGHLTLIK
ncbi:MAG: ice-binding family protein [Bacteroidota bacterium]|nr:ice-binding family protein [Bacteroidota bacterium]MDP4234166.1 ice-binding family protein [Bacteroidota bacterium]MDP4244012.1 ice-binding family protein [Bacteroidota bacterium]MDP4287866.1 ice-binding family protein [Bacteroidota bacterium]